MAATQYPVILMYHSISEGVSPLKISPALFAQQMEWLKVNARVVPLGDLVSVIRQRTTLPERTVALTFDDGFRDFYDEAAPVLHQHQFPATVFLPTAFCGRTNRWPGQPDWVEEQKLMGWAEISELSRAGVTFGAHSVSHANLSTLELNEAKAEITGSKAQIEDRIGEPAAYFAYPYGRWNAQVRELVQEQYAGACSTAAATVERDADPFALPRVDAHYVRSLEWFHRLFTTPFLVYLSARRIVRRLRGQPEGLYSKVD
jgi:peptidoglycan/xylan/chitin deacetylase (PgdA/CDA1 family)